MISNEKLDELELIISDLKRAYVYQKNSTENQPFVLMSLSDGSKVATVLGEAEKKQINDKAEELEALLKAKIKEL